MRQVFFLFGLGRQVFAEVRQRVQRCALLGEEQGQGEAKMQ